MRKDAGNGRPVGFDGSFASTHANRYGEDGVSTLLKLFSPSLSHHEIA
jgi:hypothetical protein